MLKKSYITFSHRKPFWAALLISIFTFLLLFYESIDNPNRPENWKYIIVPIYSFIAGVSFLLLKASILRWIDEDKWNFLKDFLYAIGVVIIAFVLIFSVNFIYKSFYFVNYTHFIFENKGRLIFYLLFIGFIDFGLIKLLDFYFGLKLELFKTKKVETNKIKFIGKNKDDILLLELNHFIMVEAMGNYVLIYFSTNNEKLEKMIIRNSISEIEAQISNHENIIRVHRSFIINLNNIISLDYSKRRSFLRLRLIDSMIPVAKDTFYDLMELYQPSHSE